MCFESLEPSVSEREGGEWERKREWGRRERERDSHEP